MVRRNQKNTGIVVPGTQERRAWERRAPALRMKAFSAIELIGVLSVIAIAAAAIVPNVIRKIDRATWVRETSDLSTMANGLVQTIKRDKQIPATNAIAQAIAKYSDLATSQVTNTSRGLRRLFLADPGISINGLDLSSAYIQGSSGASSRPANTRVMILSTIALPAVSTISDSFANIWNTPINGKPASWTGKADDLCIQRVELGSLFHKVYLLNIDTNHLGRFTLETNAPVDVAYNGGELTAYVLDGTALNLYEMGGTTLEVRVIIVQDESFVYQSDRWSRGLTTSQLSPSLGAFGVAVQNFLVAPSRPAKFASTQQAVIDEFYTYLSSYALWASGNPAAGVTNFQGTGTANSAPQYPYYGVLHDSQGRLDSLTGNLLQPQ